MKSKHLFLVHLFPYAEFVTLAPGHGNVFKGKKFVQQERQLLEEVVCAMNQEIGRTNAEPQKRFIEVRNAVERTVDWKTWEQKFAGDDHHGR